MITSFGKDLARQRSAALRSERRATKLVRAVGIAALLAALLIGSGRAATTEARALRQSVAAVALEDAAQIVVLRGAPWRVVRRVRVPAGPHNVAASTGAALFAITSPRAGAVTFVRRSARSLGG